MTDEEFEAQLSPVTRKLYCVSGTKGAEVTNMIQLLQDMGRTVLASSIERGRYFIVVEFKNVIDLAAFKSVMTQWPEKVFEDFQ
jgi:hypothetical protein